MKPFRRISAGQAFDKLRAVRENTKHRAQELFNDEMSKLLARELAIRELVHTDEQALVDTLLATLKPEDDDKSNAEMAAVQDTSEQPLRIVDPDPDVHPFEPARKVGKPRGA